MVRCNMTGGFYETYFNFRYRSTIAGNASASRQHCRLTANGERFQPLGLTAAHRKLPFGTKLKVTNLKNGKSVLVRVNDRGPFIKGRILDLSLGAAKVIGLNKSGVAKISFVIIH
jgi:rare lipoprotein A